MDIPLALTLKKGRSAEAIYAQIRGQIQGMIAEGKLPPGTRLPAVRILARQLKLNHLTVLRAYQELESMGYIEMGVGIGSFVAERIPEQFTSAPGKGAGGRPARLSHRLARTFSPRAAVLDHRRLGMRPLSADHRFGFFPAIGDLGLFPLTVWRKLLNDILLDADFRMLNYQNPGGHPALVEAIRSKVLPAAGITASPEEVLVTSGSGHSLHLMLDLILTEGSRVVVEDPCHFALPDIVRARGGGALPVPVGPEGIRLDALGKALRDRRARAVVLTPSHQFPTTATMGFAERGRLLEMLSGKPVWLLEDSFDNDLHYDSPPVASLASMDRTGQVVYLGSFSKTLFPALRLGFVVASPEVIARLKELQLRSTFHPPILEQLALARFIAKGHYEHHIRRTRRIYMRRRDALAALLRKSLPDFTFSLPKGGMRIWVTIPRGLDAGTLARRVAEKGIWLPANAHHAEPRDAGRHLHLGFACLTEEQIAEGIAAIAGAARTA